MSRSVRKFLGCLIAQIGCRGWTCVWFSVLRTGLVAMVAGSFLLMSEAVCDSYSFFRPLSGYVEVGDAQWLEGEFDSVTHRLTFRVNFLPRVDSQGRTIIPNGYQLVMNNGPFPVRFAGLHAGEVAVVYFDGRNPNDPVITIYGYNGRAGWMEGPGTPQNGLPPDRIFSSRIHSGEVDSVRVISEGDGSRTFEFIIDATRVWNHAPVYPAPPEVPWYGIGFDDLVGIWFFPNVITDSAYGAHGFLSNWRVSHEGWIDFVDMPTDKLACRGLLNTGLGSGTHVPSEELSKIVEVGEEYIAQFQPVTDPQPGSLLVSYEGLPPRSEISPPDGSLVNPALASSTIEFSWTPREVDRGARYEVTVSYTSIEGITRDCPFTLEVPAVSLDPTPEPTPNPTPNPSVTPSPSPLPSPEPTPSADPTPECPDVDRCGVCGGDGTSCLQCSEEVDYTQTLFVLDQLAKAQEQVVIKAAKVFRRRLRTAQTEKFLKKQLAAAHAEQIENWTITWTMPQVMKECSNRHFCIIVDNTPVLDLYRQNALSLKKRVSKILKRLSRVLQSRGRAVGSFKKLKKEARQVYQEAIDLSLVVPETTSDCTE